MKAREECVGEQLKAQGKTIACAESCTGGLLTSRLTDVPGSSSYVRGAVVSYTNEVKEQLVGVRPETIDAYTEISAETAREMAQGIRRLLSTDIGVGITGLAARAAWRGNLQDWFILRFPVPEGPSSNHVSFRAVVCRSSSKVRIRRCR